MIERIELDSTPTDEDCAQTVDPNYADLANKQCRAYIRQLWRVLKEKFNVNEDSAPESFNLVVRANVHDFGRYYEVAIRFDSTDEEAAKLAFELDNNIPRKWDEEARKELGI